MLTSSPASALASKACSDASSSQPAPVHTHQPQTWTDAGYAFRRSLPAADHMQDWSALCRAGLVPPVNLAGLQHARSFSRNSHRLSVPPSRRPVRSSSSRRIGQFIRATRRQPDPAHILPSRPCFQFWGRLGHVHHSCLSSSPSLDGFKTIEKAFDEWAKRRFGIGQK